MPEIPATWMRGGTSKCWVFRREDLERLDVSMDEVLLRLYGSPDHRQVDGIGGGTSTTSKAVILSKAHEPDVDVDYLFAQVGIEEEKVDWGSNCGNCSTVVAPFAIAEGWVRPDGDETSVRVRNVNTGQLIVQQVPTPGGVLVDAPVASIPGVPFMGAPVRMGFVDPGGATTGRLLPTGNPRDEVDGPGGRKVEVTLVDAGAPVVIVRAESVGLSGHEEPAAIDAVPGLLASLDDIRRQASVLMGLASRPSQAARAVPKLALVAPSQAATADLTVRMLSMGRVHPAVPITGSVALTLAATTPGAIVAELTSATDVSRGLRLSTPAGTVTTFIDDHDGTPVVGVTRTYRRLASGVVILPDPPFASLDEPAARPAATSPKLAHTGGTP